MKKRIMLFLCLFLSTFLFTISDIAAGSFSYSYQQVQEQVSDKTAFILCQYRDDTNTVVAEIDYHRGTTKLGKGMWSVFYDEKVGTKKTKLSILWSYPLFGVERNSYGSFEDVFINNNDLVSYQDEDLKMPVEMQDSFECPQYAFIDLWGDHQVCFSDKESCGSRYEHGPFELVDNGQSIYQIIEEYSSDSVFDEITFDEYYNDTNLNKLIYNKTKQFYTQNYLYPFLNMDSSFYEPLFIDATIKNVKVDMTSDAYIKFKNRILDELQLKVDDGTLTQTEADLFKKKILSDESSMASGGDDSGNDYKPTCVGIFDETITKILNNIFKLIQYLGPILVAIFTIIDFFKAALSGEREDINKAVNKLKKRLVCAILLFFIPPICKFIFNFAGITVPDICIGE